MLVQRWSTLTHNWANVSTVWYMVFAEIMGKELHGSIIFVPEQTKPVFHCVTITPRICRLSRVITLHNRPNWEAAWLSRQRVPFVMTTKQSSWPGGDIIKGHLAFTCIYDFDVFNVLEIAQRILEYTIMWALCREKYFLVCRHGMIHWIA